MQDTMAVGVVKKRGGVLCRYLLHYRVLLVYFIRLMVVR